MNIGYAIFLIGITVCLFFFLFEKPKKSGKSGQLEYGWSLEWKEKERGINSNQE